MEGTTHLKAALLSAPSFTPRSGKRKRTCLDVKTKHEIIKKLKEGVSKETITNEYRIGKSTFYDLLNCESVITERNKKVEIVHRKVFRPLKNVLLDSALIKWFHQVRDRGDPISGPILQEKAKILNAMLNGSPDFKGSTGWLEKFKKRYNIRRIEVKDEEHSNDPQSAQEFSAYLQKKISEENLSLTNIYNADESGIYWRALMSCTLSQKGEEISGRKDVKDRVTALFCANATGDKRIPLLLIGKSQTPRCLKNCIPKNEKDACLKNLGSLGVIYTHQSSPWMDRKMFKEWYKDVFIPKVLEHQAASGITGKVLLILDNAPCHPSVDVLNAVNKNFEVLYLPPNVTAMIQPMNQGVISTTKKMYKRSLLRHLLLNVEVENVHECLRKFDLGECLDLLSIAWDSVKSYTLHKAWKLLLGDFLQQNENSACIVEESLGFPHDIAEQLYHLLSGPNFTIEKVKMFLLKWFETDRNDCGWEPLSDSEIIQFVTNGQEMTEKASEEEEDEAEEEEEEEEEKVEIKTEILELHEITSLEAYKGLMAFKKWISLCEESSLQQHRFVEKFENLIVQAISESSTNEAYQTL